jgi:hypothetical protein
MDKRAKSKHPLLSEEMLDEIRVSLGHYSQKFLRCLAQETRVSKWSARTAKKLLKLKHETIAVHVFQPRYPANNKWIL